MQIVEDKNNKTCRRRSGLRGRLIREVRGRNGRFRGFCRINFGAFLDRESEIRNQFTIVKNLEIILGEIIYDVTLGRRGLPPE
jgi:hypothetical protein